MGKRSDFRRIARDAYDTPAEAVAPLLPHLAPRTHFIEPCAGRGCLTEHLTHAGHVLVDSFDLGDDARVKRYSIPAGAAFITNPPWGRAALHPIIANVSDQAAAWLLIDADWIHTLQAIPYLARLRMIVSVGRVRWIEGSPWDGKDNCCCHLFDRPNAWATARFVGRMARPPDSLPLLEAESVSAQASNRLPFRGGRVMTRIPALSGARLHDEAGGSR